MKIFVTGGSGLLGGEVARLAFEQGYDVYSIYKEHPAAIGTAIKLDLTDKGVVDLIHKLKPEVVVHTAAYTDVDGCEANKELARSVNAEATKLLAVASADVGAHFIYVSTDYVFDGERGLYREDDTPNPINYYGYTKLIGEEYVKQCAKSWCIARTSVIYGWGSSKLNFATWLIQNLKQGRQVKVLIDQYVSPTLNTNLAHMLIEIFKRRLQGIIHTAGASRVSRYEFAKKLAEIFDLNPNLIAPAKMSELQWKARRPKDSSLDTSKCLCIIGEAKPMTLEDALKAMRRGAALDKKRIQT